jgi:hypothetical protein
MRTFRLSAVPMLLIAAGGLVVGLAVPAAAREASTLINGRSIAIQSIPGNRMEVNTLTGRQIKESTLGTVPTATTAIRARTLPALVWHSITAAEFENGWGNYSALSYVRRAGYAVDAQGQVHLRGTVTGGTSGLVAFTLPSADLPISGADFQIPISLSGGYIGILSAHPNGIVLFDGPLTPNGSASVFTDLDGVVYSPAG